MEGSKDRDGGEGEDGKEEGVRGSESRKGTGEKGGGKGVSGMYWERKGRG